jgi:hypothetical protein
MRHAPPVHVLIPECSRAGLGSVPLSPRRWQEHVTKLGLPAVRTDATLTLRVAPIERHHADHRAIEIDHEEAGAQRPKWLTYKAIRLPSWPRP